MTASLDYCVRHRHSIRFYTNEDVPEDIIRECVALASLAPSNSNMQNWQITLARGAVRDRVVNAMKAAAAEGDPQVPPLPDKFKHYRSEFGHKVYGDEGYGIGRHEPERLMEARMRNLEFFGAPVVGILSMHEDLVMVDALSVGLFVQTLVLALTERGLGTCLQVSVTGYPEVCREQFKLPKEQRILCGIAIGYPAKNNKVNELVMGRDDVDAHMTFLSD